MILCCRSYLLERGADPLVTTEDGETGLDLVEARDYRTMAVLLGVRVETVRRKLSGRPDTRTEPAWVRRESVQEEREAKKKIIANMEKDRIVEEETEKVEEAAEGDEAAAAAATVQSETKERKRRVGQMEMQRVVKPSCAEISKKDAR